MDEPLEEIPYKVVSMQKIAENYLNRPKRQIDHNCLMIDDIYHNHNTKPAET